MKVASQNLRLRQLAVCLVLGAERTNLGFRLTERRLELTWVNPAEREPPPLRALVQFWGVAGYAAARGAGKELLDPFASALRPWIVSA